MEQIIRMHDDIEEILLSLRYTKEQIEFLLNKSPDFYESCNEMQINALFSNHDNYEIITSISHEFNALLNLGFNLDDVVRIALDPKVNRDMTVFLSVCTDLKEIGYNVKVNIMKALERYHGLPSLETIYNNIKLIKELGLNANHIRQIIRNSGNRVNIQEIVSSRDLLLKESVAPDLIVTILKQKYHLDDSCYELLDKNPPLYSCDENHELVLAYNPESCSVEDEDTLSDLYSTCDRSDIDYDSIFSLPSPGNNSMLFQWSVDEAQDNRNQSYNKDSAGKEEYISKRYKPENSYQ